jgi:hypothetical protein
MLGVCHRVVITADIQREWRNHFSSYSLLWLGAMQAKRKVVVCEPERRIELQKAMAAEGFTTIEEAAVLKDVLLIEAAVETDNAVVSLDEQARRLYIRLARRVPAIRSTVWVNPVRFEDRPIEWLRSGARLERDRRLGSAP